MRLILVRHGETSKNAENLCQGLIDIDLNEKGFEQAKRVAERLKNEKIDVIYSSDLKRAKQTAEEISKFHDCEVTVDKRLREQNKGVYEGKKSGEEIWEDFKKSGEEILDWVPEGGESLGEVKRKVFELIDEIVENRNGETVLFVSHGGVLAIISRIFQNDLELKPLGEGVNHVHKNTAVSIYDLSGSEWKLIKHNCTEHLK